MYIYIYMYIGVHKYIYVYVCIYIYIHTYIHKYACMHACINARMYVCRYVGIHHIYIYTCMHVQKTDAHIHIHVCRHLTFLLETGHTDGLADKYVQYRHKILQCTKAGLRIATMQKRHCPKLSKAITRNTCVETAVGSVDGFAVSFTSCTPQGFESEYPGAHKIEL